MGHHRISALADQRLGRGISAAGDLRRRRTARADIAAAAGVRSIIGRLAASLARYRVKAAALRDLSTVEDYVLRDIGLNRSLIDRSRYRITRPGADRNGVGR